MAEHPKIKFTRNLCRSLGKRYQIKGPNDALYLYSLITRSYMQVCFSLLNLSEADIETIVRKHI